MPTVRIGQDHGRELDFVMVRGCDEVVVVESQWNSATFDPTALVVFRGCYPKGRNYLVSPAATLAYTLRFGPHELRV